MDLCEVTGNVNRHPWELSRTDCILKVLCKLGIKGKVLDIGCGDAFFDQCLLKSDKNITELWGADTSLTKNYFDGIGNWVSNLEDVTPNKFDTILLMDVIEHIQDDEAFVGEIKGKLNDDGMILITVPAFQWLFSLHDEELHHFRRYDYKELKRIVEKSGFDILCGHYFYAMLVIARMLTRNKTENLGIWQKSENHIVTKTIRCLLNVDFAICKFLSKLKIRIGGLSLLMVIRKRTEET